MLQLNDNLKIAILFMLVSAYILYDQKPDIMFHEDGRFKNFGLKKDETICHYIIIITLIGFTTYYYLLIKGGKYV
jgi:hypothetical protein|tara:strand:+ start:24 stop:248 length:225 start_codon:yes stop_codon:yes gene_type:complete